MDGYDVIRSHDNSCITVTYAVYTMKAMVKHYRNGYSSYKLMIAAHPELKR